MMYDGVAQRDTAGIAEEPVRHRVATDNGSEDRHNFLVYAGQPEIHVVRHAGHTIALAHDGRAAMRHQEAAQRIRAKTLDPSLSVVIYTIGMGGLLGNEEHILLKRIANTEDSPMRDANSPTGLYIAAPTAAQLNSAFPKIASEVLRLSK